MQSHLNSIKTARRSIAFSIDLSKRRHWFAEGEGDTTADTSKDTTATKTDAKGADDELQKRIDAVAGNVRKEATAKATVEERERLLKALGVDPKDEKALDNLKALLAEANQAKEAKKSAEEKALEKIAQLEKERDEQKALAEKVLNERLLEKRDNKVVTALRDDKLHCKNPEKVFKLLKADHESELAALLKDDGSVDETKLKTLVDLGKKENPEYFTGGGPSIPSTQGGRPAPMTDKQAERRVAIMSQRTTRG